MKENGVLIFRTRAAKEQSLPSATVLLYYSPRHFLFPFPYEARELVCAASGGLIPVNVRD
jgi:hypothetical protein